MKKPLVSAGLIFTLLVALGQYVQIRPEPPKKGAPPARPGDERGKASPAADRSADEKAIRANIARFVKAYNDGDAKVVASLFTPEGQTIDKEGNEAHGREEIARTFAELFKEHPKKRLEVLVESIRFLGADLAEEVGTTKETFAPGEPEERDRYTALHVKRDGKWQMALAREEEGEPPTAHERRCYAVAS
jgi:uncharacterized protein (TIGR02246 family)